MKYDNVPKSHNLEILEMRQLPEKYNLKI